MSLPLLVGAITSTAALTGVLERPDLPSLEASPSAAHVALAAGASLVPGLLVHGSGHFVLGEEETAYRLLAAEGVGLGLLGVGFGGLAVTGASRRLSGPLIGAGIAGAMLTGVSWLADTYGVLAPEGGLGAPRLDLPPIEARLGWRFVSDPTATYGQLLVPGARVAFSDFWVDAEALIALDAPNARVSLVGAWRLDGPRHGEIAADGSFLDVVIGARHHHHGDGDFAVTTVEAMVNGRYDLARIGRTLRGTFVELGLGAGLEAYDFFGEDGDGNEILLGRFAVGGYFGAPGRGWGEVSAYYDHRHDGFAAGFKMPGAGSGTAGHFGLAARILPFADWGVDLDLAVGSAWVGGLSLVYRRAPR